MDRVSICENGENSENFHKDYSFSAMLHDFQGKSFNYHFKLTLHSDVLVFFSQKKLFALFSISETFFKEESDFH